MTALVELLRWTAEKPAIFSSSTTNVQAVVNDIFETTSGELVPAAMQDVGGLPEWTLAACHLLWHSSFRDLPAKAVRIFLADEVGAMAETVPVSQIADDERREELIRRACRCFSLRLDGESVNDAEDRFRQVDSVEHEKVLREAAARQKRAREVRDAIANKAAAEAAAKVSRE